MALRLSTLMRSIDVAHVLWGLWTHETFTFFNTTDNAGQLPNINITGGTFELIVEHFWRIREFPGPFPFQHLHDRSKPLSIECISKLAKLMMQRCGVDPAFQPHSLRVTAATAMVERQPPFSSVEARGG